jgi:hypothetical protein
MIPGNTTPEFFGAASASGGAYSISRSLRFNSADSAYLSRTPASAGNRRTWTWAGWVKRASLSTGLDVNLFTGGTTSSDTGFMGIYIDNNHKLTVAGAVSNFLVSASVYRDVSAWYHIVAAFDATQGTNANKIKLYVNSVQLTDFSIDNRASISNQDYGINQAALHEIGRASILSARYFDGYLADIYFIDGQALTPSSFTETDATTGQLIPKAYTGTYTGNSFWLPFSDNSAATATTLGKDNFNLGNNWTPNNLSITAGSGNDSLVDVPTNGAQTDTGVGGEVRGNYATLNPLFVSGNTLSNGNLDVTTSTTGSATSVGTIAVSSGKWYWEVTPTTATSISVGVLKIGGTNAELGSTADGYAYLQSGNKYNNGSSTAYGASYTSNDVIGIALDLDAGTLVFYKNNTSQGTAFSSLSGTFYSAVGDYTSGSSVASMNFGQRAFAYTAPSGFKALCTANLTTPLVVKPNTVFDTVLWTGNGSSQSITLPGGFSPDLVWLKQRSGSEWNALFNTIVGATTRLFSNSTNAEATNAQTLTAFNSNGFSVGNTAEVNGSSSTYVAWAWDAGSSTVTNTAGSITSTVRANATAGFSIITYSSGGNGSSLDTVGHGLNVSPVMFIAKNRDISDAWYVARSDFSNPASDYLQLNSTAAKTTSGSTLWSFSSSTIGIRQGTIASASNQKIVVYAFAPVVGYSSFGSYTGDGNPDGPFVFTGMRPRWVLLKNSSSGTNVWVIYDTARDTYNVAGAQIYPNLADAEFFGASLDVLSNGFKIRSTSGGLNSSGSVYIYAAFAESPFNYARAR